MAYNSTLTMVPLDLTELNRFFNTRPSPKVHSPLSSTSTLNELEEPGDLQHCPILARHSKSLSDDFLQRAKHTHDQTWSDVQAHLPIPRLPNYHHPQPHTEVSKDINPYAAPFIPARALVPASPKISTPLGPHPPWFAAFWAGARMSALREQGKHACTLVDHRRWTAPSIAELAQHFCWKGSEGMSDELAAVAPFARAVYVRFRDAFGEWYASSFLWHLREIALATFKACWLSGHTYQRQPMAAISSALSLCIFIGDLFTQDLLNLAPAYRCVIDLLPFVSSADHVHAIHLLLLHTNQKLWLRHPDGNRAMRDLITTLPQRVTGVQNEEVEWWVDEIVGMVERWRARIYSQIPPGLGSAPRRMT